MPLRPGWAQSACVDHIHLLPARQEAGGPCELNPLWQDYCKTLSATQQRKVQARGFKEKAVTFMSEGHHNSGTKPIGDRRVTNFVTGYQYVQLN